jgi:formylglycine-generating enzyme required for sulfatase activity
MIPGEKITMTRQRPFAWLRRVTINSDGTTTFGMPPRGDDEFKRDLAEFSKKQSAILCERKFICDTVDAHYAVLVPSQHPPLSAGQERALKPHDWFKECETCPEMVVVSSGRFMMGSPQSDKDRNPFEGPEHSVTFARNFAAGRFAVTFAEWDSCLADGGCSGYRPSDQGWGRDERPVINVSWDDAQSYVAWLSRKTGKPYRLLSEAEREYVTRAGTTTPYWWGATISAEQANYNGRVPFDGRSRGEFRKKTVPVETFSANAWGLFQVHGNIYEWVEDCWNPSYAGAPANGSPWTSGDCDTRVLRGGSWLNHSKYLRSAYRDRVAPGERSNHRGFRVARSIESAVDPRDPFK